MARVFFALFLTIAWQTGVGRRSGESWIVGLGAQRQEGEAHHRCEARTSAEWWVILPLHAFQLSKVLDCKNR